MSATFIDHHRGLVTWLASIVLIGLVLLNGLLFFQQMAVPNQAAASNPILTLPNGELLASGQPTEVSDGFAWMPIVVSVGGMLLFAAGLGGFNLIMIKRAVGRDQQRQKDLRQLAEALEAYYEGYGHYPISSSYEEGYYKAILITNEWRHYDLPAAEVMKTYLPSWPISDPSIGLKDGDQSGNYLYYPQANGQYFSLYAAMERGHDQAVAVEDGLAKEFDYYNYRTTSLRPRPTAVAVEPVSTPDSSPALAIAASESSGVTLSQADNQFGNLLAHQVDEPASAQKADEQPVIQESTLPLDVRLAQGTGESVMSGASPQAAEPLAQMESQPQSQSQPQSPSQPAVTRPATVDWYSPAATATVAQPRRQLTFEMPSAAQPAPLEQTDTEKTVAEQAAPSLPPAITQMPAVEEGRSPIDAMPPLFGSDEDLR